MGGRDHTVPETTTKFTVKQYRHSDAVTDSVSPPIAATPSSSTRAGARPSGPTPESADPDVLRDTLTSGRRHMSAYWVISAP